MAACSGNAKPTAIEANPLEDEAEQFALQVVQYIIQGNASAFQEALSDTLYFLEPWEPPILTSELSIVEEFENFDYSDYTI